MEDLASKPRSLISQGYSYLVRDTFASPRPPRSP
jgi:hypothetical protein